MKPLHLYAGVLVYLRDNEKEGYMVSFKGKQVLQIIDDLIQIHKTLQNEQSHSDNIGLLCSCQDAAILVGKYFETLDVDCSHIVEELGEYCETIYQIGMAHKGNGKDADLHMQIQNQLANVRKEIEEK